MITTAGAAPAPTLDGVTAVVTGASRGIGEAIARALALSGATVALVARGRDALERVATDIGPRAHVVSCDVRDATSVQGAVAAITAAFGELPRVLVNNAGIFDIAPLVEQSPDAFAATIDANLVAPFRFVHAFLPAMLAAGRGHVVTIGSVADRQPFPGNGAYAASKFGARALHEVLRAETRGSGVRATLVSPAATDTTLWDEVRPEHRRGLPARDQMLRPDDVARAVLYVVTQPPHVTVDELRLSRS